MDSFNISFKEHNRLDIGLRVKWLSDSDINKYLGYDFGTNDIREKEWFDDYEILRAAGKKLFFTICANNESIGLVGLSNIEKDKVAEIFILIGEKEYWGKNIGEVALNFIQDIGSKEFRLKRIYLFVDQDNKRAIKLYQRLGYVLVKEVNEKKGKLLLMEKILEVAE